MLRRIHLQCWRPGLDPWIGKIPWRREWLPTPVFWPGEFHGQRSRAGYSPWGRKHDWVTFTFTFFSTVFPPPLCSMLTPARPWFHPGLPAPGYSSTDAHLDLRIVLYSVNSLRDWFKLQCVKNLEFVTPVLRAKRAEGAGNQCFILCSPEPQGTGHSNVP